MMGSPPRMRGKVKMQSMWAYNGRITPAYAGKRYITDHHSTPEQDHPRVCGEKKFCLVLHPPAPGSPPRVRGKGVVIERRLQSVRITPACAGKSTSDSAPASSLWDHPRVCGEKVCGRDHVSHCEGSPPRVRGKEKTSSCSLNVLGITPACAGKSVLAPKLFSCEVGSPPRVRGKVLPDRGAVECVGDHPRVCGEKCL